MNERRAEQRWMCSELVTVQLENEGQTMVANLEDISPSGACLELEQAVPREAPLVMDCSNCRFRGRVKYCVLRQSGYQVGVHFTECKWSREKYAPEHLLDGTLAPGDLATLIWDGAKVDRLLGDLARLPRPRRGERLLVGHAAGSIS
jgi:hypothetical protein